MIKMDILYDDICSNILEFCDPLDLFKLKMVSKRFNCLVAKYKEKKGKLFRNELDMWCRSLLQKQNQAKNIEFLSTIFELNHVLVLAVGYIGNSNIIDIYNLKYDILVTDEENMMLVKVNGVTSEDLEFEVDTHDLLDDLEKYGDIVIEKCVLNLPEIFQHATKPWKFQGQDFFYTVEEFFWGPDALRHQSWFRMMYPNISNYLNRF